MSRIIVFMNNGKEYPFNIDLDKLMSMILTEDKQLKNELIRIENVMINPTNISSVEFDQTHTTTPKFTGVYR
ncbi:hypothetical protein [Bacillus sp. NPDC060175]|uniref:hypothetical protein n=1 Tax=Bacillus sp. NPDC060175 TaxID=3347061 RepID=UPI00364A7C9E